MSDEKKQLSDAEVAEVQGGQDERPRADYMLYDGRKYYRYDPGYDVTIYCPQCKATEFWYRTAFFIPILRCAKCCYEFYRDLEGASSVGGDW